MNNLIRRFAADTSGATAIEYGLVAALVAVVLTAGATTPGSNLSAKFTAIATKIGTTVP
jgi:pilus assembly protein Flp/PilA